jgi:urea transport system permease protein
MTTSSLKTNVLLPASSLPGRRPLLSKAGWSAFMLALIAVCALAPVLNLWVPEGSALHLSTTPCACWARSCATPSARWPWT